MTNKTAELWPAIYNTLVRKFSDPDEGLAQAEKALGRHFLTSSYVLQIVDAMIAGKPSLAADDGLPLELRRSWMIQPLIKMDSDSLRNDYGVSFELIETVNSEIQRLCKTFNP